MDVREEHPRYRRLTTALYMALNNYVALLVIFILESKSTHIVLFILD